MNPNPYQNLPATSFWTKAIARSASFIPANIYKKKWLILKNHKIATAGSCFAQHIGRHLKVNGYQVLDKEPAPEGLTHKNQLRFGFSMYSARYGNIYTTRQLLQLAKEAFGEHTPEDVIWRGENGSYYDALRPNIEPEGLGSENEVIAHREHHLKHVRELFESMDLFIFTMGLTEAWVHKSSGTVYPTAPGVIAGEYNSDEYEFNNFTYNEVLDDFNEFKKLILSKQTKPNKTKFLLTVSPVPLTATASEQHVLLATIYSKSVLRAVAGELTMKNSDIDYFPSYEIISNPWSDAFLYEKNKRSIKEIGVEEVMFTFFKEHLHEDHTEASAPTPPKKQHTNDYEEDVICEESILDAFGEKE